MILDNFWVWKWEFIPHHGDFNRYTLYIYICKCFTSGFRGTLFSNEPFLSISGGVAHYVFFAWTSWTTGDFKIQEWKGIRGLHAANMARMRIKSMIAWVWCNCEPDSRMQQDSDSGNENLISKTIMNLNSNHKTNKSTLLFVFCLNLLVPPPSFGIWWNIWWYLMSTLSATRNPQHDSTLFRTISVRTATDQNRTSQLVRNQLFILCESCAYRWAFQDPQTRKWTKHSECERETWLFRVLHTLKHQKSNTGNPQQ